MPELDILNKLNAKLDEFQGQLDQLAKLPKPVRQAMAPGAAFLVIGAFLYFVLFPANAEVKELQAQARAKQIELSKAESVAENLPQFEKELENLEADLKVALRQLPNSREIPGLLTDISTLGKNAGLDIKRFKPNVEIPRGFYAEVPLEIAFTGTFHQVVTFFDLVAKLPRIVNVGELKMEIEDEGSEETVLKVSGKATTFRFIDQNPNQTAATFERPRGDVG
jgi:type IV pilus assembly protein PilO